METHIDRPRAVALARATDVPRWPEFISAIAQIERLADGDISPGSRFRETRTMFGRQAFEETTVADLEPCERFVLAAHDHGIDDRAVHKLQEHGSGTRLVLSFEGRPPRYRWLRVWRLPSGA